MNHKRLPGNRYTINKFLMTYWVFVFRCLSAVSH